MNTEMAIDSKFSFRACIGESLMATWVLVGLVGYGVYFYRLMNPSYLFIDPLEAYHSDPVIISLSFGSLIAHVVFLVAFVLLASDHGFDNLFVHTVYIFSALMIAYLQWYELYFGSTFYYGEVRDENALAFPIFSAFLANMLIWKYVLAPLGKHDICLKLSLVMLLHLFLYLLWVKVFGIWELCL